MKFEMTISGDLDEKLTIKASLGKRSVEGEVTTKGPMTKCTAKLEDLLSPYQREEDDEGFTLVEATDALTDGLMEFFRLIKGNV